MLSLESTNPFEVNRMARFEVGDVVYHKSNLDIPMTVFEYEDNQVWCRWVNKDRKVHQEKFLEAELFSAKERDREVEKGLSDWD